MYEAVDRYFYLLLFADVLGIILVAVGWRGLRVSKAWAILVVGIALGGVVLIWFSYPRLWCWTVPPIYLGWLALRFRASRSAATTGLRFTLRGMLIFIIALSLTLGGFTNHLRREKYEQELVASLPNGVQLVLWSFRRVYSVLLTAETEREFDDAAFTLSRLSDLRLLSIQDVEHLPGRITQKLSALQTLTSLTIFEPALSDADLEPVGRLTRLEWLKLSVVNGQSLAHLTTLKRLESLFVDAARNSDEPHEIQTANIASLSSLRTLDLWEFTIRDGDLKPIGQLLNLEWLRFRNQMLSISGYSYLEPLKKLKSLHLAGPVSDSDLEGLGQLTQLEELRLQDGKQVTAAGLVHLYSLKHLRELYIDVYRRNVPQAAIEKLESELPRLKVYY